MTDRTYKSLRFWRERYGLGLKIRACINGLEYYYDHDKVIDQHFPNIKDTLSWERGVYSISQRDCAQEHVLTALRPYEVRGC